MDNWKLIWSKEWRHLQNHSLKVIGYSLTKKTKPENDMVVGTFDFGGHKWAIKFSPYGYHYNWIHGLEWMTLHVLLLTVTTTVMALEVGYSLLHHKSGTYSTSDVNAAAV
jgi:hypothetical protein